MGERGEKERGGGGRRGEKRTECISNRFSHFLKGFSVRDRPPWVPLPNYGHSCEREEKAGKKRK